MGMRDKGRKGVDPIEVVLVPTDEVKQYGGNSKIHDDEQIAKLAKQITEHGWDQPIVVDGGMVIIKGHGRHMAAKYMGLGKVPVIIRKDLSPAQVRAARIADNKLAETGWNYELLTDEMRALMDEGFDMSLTAFDDDELKKLLKETGASQVSSGEVSEDGFNNLRHKCPRCQYEFNDD